MAQAAALSLDFAAVTDIGCSRSNNEDSYGYDADQHIYVVCDGMGGSAAGEVASGMAVRTLIESYGVMAQDPPAGERQPPLENRLLSAIMESNRVVWDAGTKNPELHRMGTTLVCACMDGDRIIVGNVGDSRAYLLRNGNCLQITEDHSLLDQQIRIGNITEEMAAASNLQSVITRAVGAMETVEPDFFAARIQPADMLLLASDGLTRYMQPHEIALVAFNGSDLTAICNGLVTDAKQKGGADNITCILLRVVEVPPTPQADNADALSPAI